MVGYQVYVLSFADSNGDGIGDLAGITQRLEHIAWLGADIVWLNPFYPSPGRDHGYDVSDYCAVDPKHGTMEDFRQFADKAHSLGLAVVVDIVPNHTSSDHPWFQESRDPNSAKRDWYVWRDPGPNGGPPNNWLSHFGGPAWTLDEASGQYWCHLFLPEQPDLNWRNEEVQEAFDDIFRFWCQQGVDGFRLDVAHALMKHPDFPDNPMIAEPQPGMGARGIFNCFEHRYDLDQDDNVQIFRRWHDVVAPALLLGEIFITEGHRFARYVSEGALDAAFHLPPMWASWEPAQLVREILDLCEHAPDEVSWILSNHDGSRPVSRFGGGEAGLRRAFAVTTAMSALGGLPFIFQGEELGLPNSEIAAGDLSDPLIARNKHGESRDVCRTPMPWDNTHINGFTTADKAWLQAPPRPPELTVEGQRDNPNSPLAAYRSLIHLRKTHPEIWNAPLDKAEALAPEVLYVSRGDICLVANLSTNPFQATLDTPAIQLFTSDCVTGREDSEIEKGMETAKEMETAKGRAAANTMASTNYEIPPETAAIFLATN